jgi:mono/diheme cytochrome c family protein
LRSRPTAALAALAVLAACGGDDDRAPAPPRGDAGLRVWVAQGCGSCHTFEAAGATGQVGPDLDETLKGRSAAYIRESIVDPAANVPAGEDSLMPDDFGRRIRPAELEALVAFIVRGVR